MSADTDAHRRQKWVQVNAELAEFEFVDLPAGIVSKVLDFTRRMGLITGSFDFIVDKHGEHWFLECNQGGAWGWLDPIVDGGISDAFVVLRVRLFQVRDVMKRASLWIVVAICAFSTTAHAVE